ncbi:MAG: hypothetical protein SFY69_03430 [Planctomycetota bacterium]|nr:hypothetical protein [Planctomycetota bacterium]
MTIPLRQVESDRNAAPSGVGLVAAWGVLLGGVAFVALPAFGVARSLVGGVTSGRVTSASLTPSAGLLLTTGAWCVGVAVLATALALPAGWWLGRRGGRAAWWAGGLTMLFPSFLSYAAYGLARAPGTWTGDLIARAAERGWTNLPVLAGRVVAAGGLALWAWPLAALIVAWGVRAIPREALDSLRLDVPGRGRRAWHVVRMVRAQAAASVGVIALLMAGSAVPLHLAQAPTYSVRVWLELTTSPGSPAAWAASWPLLVLGVGGAVWLGGTVARVRMPGGEEPAGALGPASGAAAWFWGLVVLSTAVPAGLMAGSLTSLRPLLDFWTLSGAALGASTVTAAIAGILGGALCVGVWIALSVGGGGARRVVRAAGIVWFVGALTPGVLVGQALSTAWTGWDALLESPFAPAFAHVVRFGAIGVVIGVLLAGTERASERDLRAIDGQGGLGGFLRVVVRGRAMAAAGVGAAIACLSLHEIETGVLLQPPGTPSFAQIMLGYLHFSRLDDLAAAVVWLLALGGVAGGLGALVAARLAPHPCVARRSTIPPESA